MLDLTPVKILLVMVVAIILVGPQKLPQVARQLGAGWRKLRDFHEQVDREVRQTIPDLPSTTEIARLARSPVALLNQLAKTSADDLVEDPGATNGTAASGTAASGTTANGTADHSGDDTAAWPEDRTATVSPSVEALDTPTTSLGGLGEVPDDPTLN